uniref:Maternal protein pumilio (inferred by orthology to a D. melanogaster protein) n=1 Tax=Strongyloides venezuelensis TaxID=75913 RepID=A0A0K0FVM2_STRVS
MHTDTATCVKEFEDFLNSKQFEEGCYLIEEKKDELSGIDYPFDLPINDIQSLPSSHYDKIPAEERDLSWGVFERELLHPMNTCERTPCIHNNLVFSCCQTPILPLCPQAISPPVPPNIFPKEPTLPDFWVTGHSPTSLNTCWTPPISPFSAESVTLDNGLDSFLTNDNHQNLGLEKIFTLKNGAAQSPTKQECHFAVGGQKLSKQKSAKLLERCRNGKFEGLDLDDIKAHIYTFATDQFGSRFIQQMYDSASKEKKASAFTCLLPHIFTLSCDPFGNYIVQKLFASGDELQRGQMLEVLHGQILELSLDAYGCRVMQKALETGDSEEASYIANEIKDDIVKCMMDQHGNHVIQRIIVRISFNDYETILARIEKNKNGLSYVDLSLHQYACRVIQSIVKIMPSYLRPAMTEELYNHIDGLISHEYGNYVAQKMFVHGNFVERRKILKCFRNNLLFYSCNKYASNVIEFCLKNGTESERKVLIDTILKESTEKGLRLMIADQFGNYVIQQMISSSCGKLRSRLISTVMSLQNQLGNQSYYKNVYNKCTASRK